MVLDEYILILSILLLLCLNIYLKIKYKNTEIIDFVSDNNISIKYTILIFLVFQAVDYHYENGFIGMISQWFMYWLMGIFSVLLMSLINYYKNYKYVLSKR